MDRLVRAALNNFIRAGNLRIMTARGVTHSFGDGSGDLVAIRFTTRAAEWGVPLDPDLRLGELINRLGALPLVYGKLLAELVRQELSDQSEKPGGAAAGRQTVARPHTKDRLEVGPDGNRAAQQFELGRPAGRR